jgi:hypothetical protein
MSDGDHADARTEVGELVSVYVYQCRAVGTINVNGKCGTYAV